MRGKCSFPVETTSGCYGEHKAEQDKVLKDDGDRHLSRGLEEGRVTLGQGGGYGNQSRKWCGKVRAQEEDGEWTCLVWAEGILIRTECVNFDEPGMHATSNVVNLYLLRW